ncbi:MAG: hypothetical protein K6D97_02555 [Clostridia bacterium]|nr:hypothetical protein [Clostridia bacterium]
MENASKALIIAGAILLSILIIAIGMYIYSSAQAQVENSITNMSTSEIEGFNSTFTSYQGEQTGSQVKALLNRLVANANTYAEEPAKIPCISYNTDDNNPPAEIGKNSAYNKQAYGVFVEGQTSAYLNFISKLSQGMDLKHKYYLVMTNSTSGVLSGITINYAKHSDTANDENFQATTGNDNFHGIKGVGTAVNQTIGGSQKANIGYSTADGS